jgi:serine/threonine protein phosphatase PrpC
VANTGDSRSILSKNNGEKIQQLTYDHKPNQKIEELRIIQAGGKVYQ